MHLQGSVSLAASPGGTHTAVLMRIDHRLDVLCSKAKLSPYEKKKSKLAIELDNFLTDYLNIDFSKVTPKDICRFLVMKDDGGKTAVHIPTCSAIGERHPGCECPRRLASGTVDSLVGQLRAIFKNRLGDGAWNVAVGSGNPVISGEVKSYVKSVKEEQARAHVVPNQAIPIFLDKLSAIAMYIDRHLEKNDLSLIQRYVFLRDQAFFKLQYFGGDRAGDMGQMLTQEVTSLPDGKGFLIVHTWGKTLRGGEKRTNSFVIYKNSSSQVLCPVLGLEQYFAGVRAMGVDIAQGPLFRPVSKEGVVLLDSLSYSAVYDRLKYYLGILGLDGGETPHSLRAGCAVALGVAGGPISGGDIMNHVGWASEHSMQHYSRLPKIVESNVSAKVLQGVSSKVSISRAKAVYKGSVGLGKAAFH